MFKKIIGLLFVLVLTLGMSTLVFASDHTTVTDEAAWCYANRNDPADLFALINHLLAQGVAIEATYNNGYLALVAVSGEYGFRVRAGIGFVHVGPGNILHLRKQPYRAGVPIAMLPNGTQLSVVYVRTNTLYQRWLSVDVTWSSIASQIGLNGWVHSNYVL